MHTPRGQRDTRPLALITGAARRLGAVTTRALHSAGYDVAIHYHTSTSAARELVRELNAVRAASAFALRQDLAAHHAGERLIETLQTKAGRLDLLVNNASIFDSDNADDNTLETWERLQAINLRTPYFLARAAVTLLTASRGAIINIADIHAERPRAGYAMYGASKAGLIAVTRSLALELAPHIRANAISPGAILWASTEDDELQARTLDRIPLERRGDPADIADAVLYLARAHYVTGQVLNIDGGRLLWG
ncbi:MAG: pteridine reductase [Gammaproteobacteria bacterium]